MKFPYIGKNKEGVEALIYSDSNAFLLCGMYSRDMRNAPVKNYFSRRYKNITAEFLANTYGKVESKDHAEFIVKLAEANGLRIASKWTKGKFFCFIVDCEDKVFLFFYSERVAKFEGEKLITIPLPPEDKSMESQKEWPQVGDKALTDSKEVVEVVAIDNDVAWVKHSFCETKYGYLSMRIKMLSKAPTPEEGLAREIEKMIYDGMDNSYDLNHNCYYLVSGLMKKYDIKKKPE